MKSDSKMILRAIELAKNGRGQTAPNPMVGAVIVKNDKVIAEGYHRKVGQAHAEIDAINNASENLESATMFVTLEPCSHVGRTAPCVDAIIATGISKVVCSIKDPNVLASGKGIDKLIEAGIEVVVGEQADTSRLLNRDFFTFHEQKRPFIAIKFAASLDGKIATKTGDSKWITSEKSRTVARKLRGNYQAIIVGINTVLADDPHLGVRDSSARDPLRIVLDSELRTPLDARVLRDKNVIIFTTKKATLSRIKEFENRGIILVTLPTESIELRQLLDELYARNIISLFVEGGSKVISCFIDAKLVDRIYAFYGPVIIGGDESLPSIGGSGFETISESLQLTGIESQQIEQDIFISGNVNNSKKE
ncbi:bifunctional diaminohydroxyphosphoribosylaminopyrimidine deaminase/5-amino-6-(5-phosphoribosylamino)uracil reductase RibD [Candidatus Saccharibacteria bacterium]|nr:bifunctional diaminohydroxyphosphoribosylaminopyrimidine deaminase/5-amino-6-(5-phosphoribosylamino)uracil reductase RibD [Candidatus Saccharibacteria bacterium]